MVCMESNEEEGEGEILTGWERRVMSLPIGMAPQHFEGIFCTVGLSVW